MWFRKVKLPGRTVWTTGRILHSLVGPHIGIWKYFYPKKISTEVNSGMVRYLVGLPSPKTICWSHFLYTELNSSLKLTANATENQCLEDDSCPFWGRFCLFSELLLLILGSAQELNFQSLPLRRFRVLPQWGYIYKLDTKLLDALTARLGRSSWKPSLQVS